MSVMACGLIDCRRQSAEEPCDRPDCPLPHETVAASVPKSVDVVSDIVALLEPLKTTERVRVLRTVSAFLDIRL